MYVRSSLWWIRSGRYGKSGPHTTDQMKQWGYALVQANSLISKDVNGPFIPVITLFPDPNKLFVQTVTLRKVKFTSGVSRKI